MSLTQQPLELLDGQHRVVLGAVVEVVRHLRHVPGHRPAQRDSNRLTGRGPDRGRPQSTGGGQQSHGESRGEHDGAPVSDRDRSNWESERETITQGGGGDFNMGGRERERERERHTFTYSSIPYSLPLSLLLSSSFSSILSSLLLSSPSLLLILLLLPPSDRFLLDEKSTEVNLIQNLTDVCFITSHEITSSSSNTVTVTTSEILCSRPPAKVLQYYQYFGFLDIVTSYCNKQKTMDSVLVGTCWFSLQCYNVLLFVAF